MLTGQNSTESWMMKMIPVNFENRKTTASFDPRAAHCSTLSGSQRRYLEAQSAGGYLKPLTMVFNNNDY